MEGVVSVFPSRKLQLQTTRSWDFMGFPENVVKNVSGYASDIIIGVIDTGIWPELPSFSDEGFSPPPKKWKGVCKGGTNFTCNNKIIGARAYSFKSARDNVGHGTHTASTAAGRIVPDASFYGLAKGSARGGTPFARIAVYKVCDDSGCAESDIMAAFDDAIADGVDLITISIGGPPKGYDRDVVAIGAFHAMEKGVLTVQSAGNDGNFPGAVGSTAPWILTVAASTTDRRIHDKVVLGDGKTFVGNSINSFRLKGENFPLIYGQDALTKSCRDPFFSGCGTNCLDSKLVKGKIVVCHEMKGVNEAFRAGALGFIAKTSRDDVSFIHPMPAIGLGNEEFDALRSYMRSTRAPVANILRSEATNDTNAPIVASFSSRGPNRLATRIPKPDITAPGVEILAGFSPLASVSHNPMDQRSVKYSVLSGTSMSCPHVAGAAAYLKSVHPDWSPAAIKSALMTTAHPMSPSKNPEGEFAYGSGHLNPLGAAHPGLLYEATKEDYIAFLCTFYKEDIIRLISGDKRVRCPNPNNFIDSNYPAMSTKFMKDKLITVNFPRTVTNVGRANSTYVAKVEYSGGSKLIKVEVEPKTLSFKSLKERKSFNVTVAAKGLSPQIPVSATLIWSDGVHSVRSPIVAYGDFVFMSN